jgi:hypothetical protein
MTCDFSVPGVLRLSDVILDIAVPQRCGRF